MLQHSAWPDDQFDANEEECDQGTYAEEDGWATGCVSSAGPSSLQASIQWHLLITQLPMVIGSSFTNDVLSLPLLPSTVIQLSFHSLRSHPRTATSESNRVLVVHWSLPSPHSHSLGLLLSSHISPHHSVLGLMGTNWDLCLPPCDPVTSSSIWETMPPPG